MGKENTSWLVGRSVYLIFFSSEYLNSEFEGHIPLTVTFSLGAKYEYLYLTYVYEELWENVPNKYRSLIQFR